VTRRAPGQTLAASRWAQLAALGVAVAVVASVRWRYSVVTVHGQSMEPELADGDRLLARRCGVRRLRCGQLVIFREPGLSRRPAWLTGAGRDRWVVKRVAAIPGDPVPDTVRSIARLAEVVPRRAIVVLGNAAESRDSRHWGFIAGSQVLGVATRRL
jgi:signal peptidase I